MDTDTTEDESSTPEAEASFAYKAAHQAFRDRWKETDDTMCRHSMSFHVQHTLRNDFFASYLYLLEKIPMGKKKGHSGPTDLTPAETYKLFLTPDSIKDRAELKEQAGGFVWFSANDFTLQNIVRA